MTPARHSHTTTGSCIVALMADVGDWLTTLGLTRYADAFRDGGVDWDVLSKLDHDILKERGVAAPADRRRTLKAVNPYPQRPLGSVHSSPHAQNDRGK